MAQEKLEKEITICNQCGQVIATEGSYVDYLSVQKTWGYFSKRDLQIDSFDLCEACYEKLIAGFKIPVAVKTNNEAI